MRRIIDLLILLMVTAALAGVLYPYVRQYRHTEAPTRAAAEERTRQALAAIQEQVVLRPAMGEAEAGPAGCATEVSPAWFREARGGRTGALPTNELVPSGQPWVDLAPPGDPGTHPPDPVITQPEQAGFWYNPARGIVRARVAPAGTPAATLDLYNRMNGTSLASLPPATPEARRPVANPAGVSVASVDAPDGPVPDEALAPAPPRTLLGPQPER